MDFIKDNIELSILLFIVLSITTIYVVSWFKNTTYKIDCLRLKEYEWDDYDIEQISAYRYERYIVYEFKTSEDLGYKFRIKNRVFEKQPLESLNDSEYTYISEKCF